MQVFTQVRAQKNNGLMKQQLKIKTAAEKYREKISQYNCYNKDSADAGYDGFLEGAEWAEQELKKSEDDVTLSFHVCNVPCPEEVMAGANAKYEAYFVSVPKNLIPKKKYRKQRKST